MGRLRVVSTEVVQAGLGWGEGPVVYGGGIVFSDIPNDVMHTWRDGEVSVFRQPTRHTNGNTTDREGRLISCEHQSRSVVRTAPDGSLKHLATHWLGRRLNSPNDVVVASDGGVWFTDPPYMLLNGQAAQGYKQEIDFGGVYRVDPESGKVELMIDALDKPNGLCFSRDERTLFVSDTGYSHRKGGNHHVFAFEMRDGRPRDLVVFAAISPGACDGLRVDAAGLVWVTSGEGAQLLSADGEVLRRIEVGEMGTNLCFLPGDRRGVFLTTPTRAIVVEIDATGQPDGFARTDR
jgi:gluconolactonase